MSFCVVFSGLFSCASLEWKSILVDTVRVHKGRNTNLSTDKIPELQASDKANYTSDIKCRFTGRIFQKDTRCNLTVMTTVLKFVKIRPNLILILYFRRVSFNRRDGRVLSKRWKFVNPFSIHNEKTNNLYTYCDLKVQHKIPLNTKFRSLWYYTYQQILLIL